MIQEPWPIVSVQSSSVCEAIHGTLKPLAGVILETLDGSLTMLRIDSRAPVRSTELTVSLGSQISSFPEWNLASRFIDEEAKQGTRRL